MIELIRLQRDTLMDSKSTEAFNIDRIREWKAKAEKWDALEAEIAKCYCNSEGDYDEDNPEIEGADITTVGEIAATAFGRM